ncbi:hypothetical protein COLO4_37109 [Corchorus olitorius]|uniref:ELYS-like domain-containing protein n=1 Tax=Corchorus olitorius TaxID=93759 RepID=A0A1R3G3A1_9ROSI|nr:hypothetical protein COLO4_37109 [Corchorus olitorius]
MEKAEINGPILPSSSAGNSRTVRSLASPPLQPNYSSRPVQEALEHLASIDLSELFNEAKVEYCRAARDLRSCGRYVQYALNSCGHASLCAECSQRCDLCPICRIPLPKSGNNRIRLRLYDECVDAGLISRRCDERFQDKEDRDNQLAIDVQRLYSFFDVALENNLVSLVCHYVTDICMDETAVSSDAVTALLLDEKVVKDWVKRTFKNITAELQGIYYQEIKEMKDRLCSLLKFSVHLAGLSSVLEVLESSFKGRLVAQLHDLHQLQEGILKTKQHLEIAMWCIRHQFLEHVKSRHANFTSWRNLVRERKAAAIDRAWPDVLDHLADSTGSVGSLFIEDALANLDIEQAYDQEMGDESDFPFLQKNGALSFFKSKIEGMTGCYPFENLRAAVDILFLRSSSDLVVAKRAIFLYYLFDRHWSMPEEEWRPIVDDFAASFGISRHLLLESFTFCLLDDHSDDALLESHQLLPEISGPATHPKIAQVLLERQNPEAAQMVLRCSGRDVVSQLVSLSEAVTIVRVKMECALLTEAFTYQRMLCTKVRDKKFKYGPSGDAFDDMKGQCRSWMDWVEVLVSEICCLCIRRNLVDRMIELPWNSDEEKYIHKCLLDQATAHPLTTIGSLLVVFYLQRYRYVEAYQVNLKLWSLEQEFISNNSVDEEVLSRMESQRQRRKELVDKGIELLPEVLQQQVKTGTFSDTVIASGQVDEMSASPGLSELQEPKSTLLVPSTSDSILLRPDHMATPFRPPVFEIPKGGYVDKSHVEAGDNGSSSILQGKLFADAERASNLEVVKNFKFDDISSPGIRRLTPIYSTPVKGISWSSSRELPNRHLQEKQSNIIILEGEQNGFVNQVRKASPPYSRRVTANPVSTPSSNSGLFKGFANNLRSDVSGKRGQSDRDDGHLNVPPTEDSMDVSWSHERRSVDERNGNVVGLRWRSDEASDEEEQSPQIPEEVGFSEEGAMQNNSKNKCTSTSHQLMVDNAKNRLNYLQERFTDLQSARKEGRAGDVAVLEEQVYQSLREWKAELCTPSPASSLLGGSLGSFSDDINRLFQMCGTGEEDDDATSPLKGPAVLKPETDIQNLSPSNLHVIPEARSLFDYLVNHEPEEHGFQGFDPCKVSTSALESTMVGNADINYQLDYHPFDLQQEFDHGLLIGANGTEDCARDANPNVLPNISPPPSAFMGPKCALWDCTRPAQGSDDWYQDYCSNFHATLALNEDPPGMPPILRPGGISLKDNLLLDALRAKSQGKNVGIPQCEGAATKKSPWNATDLFDLSLLEGEILREWLFFDKPRRAFESGNRKQRSLPDYSGRGWHESRKQVMKEFGGQKRSYYMDPQPSGQYEWHLFEYEIYGCDAFALYRLELKLGNEKKSPKVKVTKDSLADLQKKMGRLTAEVPGDDRSPGKGKTKANKKGDARNVNSAQD